MCRPRVQRSQALAPWRPLCPPGRRQPSWFVRLVDSPLSRVTSWLPPTRPLHFPLLSLCNRVFAYSVAFVLPPRFIPASLLSTNHHLPCFRTRDRFRARSPPFVGGAHYDFATDLSFLFGSYFRDLGASTRFRSSIIMQLSVAIVIDRLYFILWTSF